MSVLKWLAAAACVFLVSLPSLSQANDDGQTFVALSKLAEQGNAEAQYHVGMMLNNGIEVEKDPVEAFKWFKRSADSGGHPLSAYKVGCYYAGQFNAVPLDEDSAMRYKTIAAVAGYDLAQYDVANMFGNKNQYKDAVYWWTQAAQQGHSKSLYNLSVTYLSGLYGAKSNTDAYAYFKLAKLTSEGRVSENAQKSLDGLTKQMSAAEKEQAEETVKNWHIQVTDLTKKARLGQSAALELLRPQ